MKLNTYLTEFARDQYGKGITFVDIVGGAGRDGPALDENVQRGVAAEAGGVVVE